MTTITPYDEQTDRAATHGWRPAPAVTCPQTIAGRNCQADTEAPCLCQRHRWGALDHARVWLDRDDALVLTAEPYEISGGDLTAFVFDCALIGLRVTISGRTMWYPGWSLLLIIRKDDDTDEGPL